ncbi:hypothetical protein QUF99_26015 [Bacillus sp. DX4.1]|uniref:hypothetical protein n=1 Tax=Bacillus sp. DX4.1 TaxID=3055867 RepID=UPI0025A182B7|nr:hypothetical protein [Bacillus sp. DX4.1]MDM5190657.1 hypothetical protein [Bacillus sp. DX4.1]
MGLQIIQRVQRLEQALSQNPLVADIFPQGSIKMRTIYEEPMLLSLYMILKIHVQLFSFKKDSASNLMLTKSFHAYFKKVEAMVTYDFLQMPAIPYEGPVI